MTPQINSALPESSIKNPASNSRFLFPGSAITADLVIVPACWHIFIITKIGFNQVFMKGIKTILLTIIIITGCSLSVSAQKHPERTSSHRATYGSAPVKQKFVSKKKQKTKRSTKPHPALGTRTRGRVRALPI